MFFGHKEAQVLQIILQQAVPQKDRQTDACEKLVSLPSASVRDNVQKKETFGQVTYKGGNHTNHKSQNHNKDLQHKKRESHII